MKKVLLFLFLINLSLFSQSNEYINELYYAIKYNSAKGISNAVEYLSLYDLDLNNIFSEKVQVDFGFGDWGDANASPLIYAIDCGNIEAIDTLLKLGAKLEGLTDIYSILGDFIDAMDYTNRMSITPLMYAAYCATDEVVYFLIKKGAKVNAKNRDGKTALMYSANLRYLGSAKILINAGADVNAKDNKGRTPLMYAAEASHYNSDKDVVDLLIKNKANVNAKDNEGNTALMYACRDLSSLYDKLNPNVVKSLIKAGANINEVYKEDGNTALLYAIDTYVGAAFYWGWDEPELYDDTLPTFETIKLLINNGANVNIRNKEGKTPLSLSKGYPELNKLLRDSGAYLQ